MRSVIKDFSPGVNQTFLQHTQGLQALFTEYERTFPSSLSADEVGMRLDMGYTLPDDYLQKLDLASMHFSLEAREPMLSYKLVEWARKLPATWKIRRHTNKYILRKLVSRYLPRDLIERPKHGFTPPVSLWLKKELKAWALDLLQDSCLYHGLPFSQPDTLRIWELHQSGKRNATPILWTILMLLTFKQQWNHETLTS
jgi:asparagine synthase (glutamine-hydrolysing)